MMFLSAGRGRSTQAPTCPRCIRSSGVLGHERTCRAKLSLDPELALDPRIVPSPGLATARLAICADAEGGYLPLAGRKARARQRGQVPRGHPGAPSGPQARESRRGAAPRASAQIIFAGYTYINVPTPSQEDPPRKSRRPRSPERARDTPVGSQAGSAQRKYL